MALKSLLLSSDERTVRVLRRVLSDLEIGICHCSGSEDAVRLITRQRFEAIIVDCSDLEASGNVLRASKAAPVNKRALSIVLVEAAVGLKGGFEMGAHFVLHKPLAVERAKASFRAVRALMKSERRLQTRVPVQIPVVCFGSGRRASRYYAKSLDLCEGGMAIQFNGRGLTENSIHLSFDLPGTGEKIEIWGELAWEGDGARAGVRFNDANDNHRNALRKWISKQLPDLEPDDPPVVCRLKNLSQGACYLTTTSPFPRSTRVILSAPAVTPEVRAAGIVLLAHPEFGMGVEFVQSTPQQQEQVSRMIETLRAGGESPELHVEPDGLEIALSESVSPSASRADDTLLGLFLEHSHVSVEVFLQQMQQQPNLQASR